MSKTEKRKIWLMEHKDNIERLIPPACPPNCRAACRNGATCAIQSGGGWGYWVRAIKLAHINPSARNYWSGSNPTPSTSIRKDIADYICRNAPESLI